VLKVQQNLEPGFWGPVVMVGPVVVTTTAPKEKTTMTKVEDRTVAKLAKEALLADREGLKELFRGVLQEVLEAEMTEAVGASKSERTEGRLSYRSGYYTRGLVTRLGKIELRVPQDRQGRFSTELFERYQRSDKALLAALAEMYVQGVSTRKVKAITEELVGHSFSASSISAIVKKLDDELSRFARRRLDEPFPYLILDARYEKVRVNHVIQSQAVLVAVGIDWEGRRQILGVELSHRESRSSWRDFLTGLKERGLHGVEFVVSDDHDGLKKAIRECLPEGAWQRCYVHFLRNAIDHLPRKRDDDCLKELGWLYERRNVKEARADLKAWIERGPRPLRQAGGVGRGEHRGDVDVLFAAAGPPQEYEIDEHAGAIQRGDQTPHSRCSNLPQ
jgi:transposase-like protein